MAVKRCSYCGRFKTQPQNDWVVIMDIGVILSAKDLGIESETCPDPDCQRLEERISLKLKGILTKLRDDQIPDIIC